MATSPQQGHDVYSREHVPPETGSQAGRFTDARQRPTHTENASQSTQIN